MIKDSQVSFLYFKKKINQKTEWSCCGRDLEGESKNILHSSKYRSVKHLSTQQYFQVVDDILF